MYSFSSLNKLTSVYYSLSEFCSAVNKLWGKYCLLSLLHELGNCFLSCAAEFISYKLVLLTSMWECELFNVYFLFKSVKTTDGKYINFYLLLELCFSVVSFIIIISCKDKVVCVHIIDIIIVSIGNSAYEGLIHKQHEYNKSQSHFLCTYRR